MSPSDLATFSVRTLSGDRTWRIIRHQADGSVLDVAEVAWSVGLVRPNLTRERFERALNGRVDVQPERTWSWAPKPGTFTVWLRHNGAPVGSIEWVPGLSWKADRLRWLDAIVDGLNQDLGQKNPFPEPLPPRPRVVEPIMGDYNFATGEEIHAA